MTTYELKWTDDALQKYNNNNRQHPPHIYIEMQMMLSSATTLNIQITNTFYQCKETKTTQLN